MRKIQLGGHRYRNKPSTHHVLVDDEDYEELNQYQWSPSYHRGAVYARRGVLPTIYMHRQIMKTPKGMYTDHIDGNTLNNQKSNLRICTNAQNLWNQAQVGRSGYKGVSFHKSTGKYRARLSILGKDTHLGLFVNKVDAYRAYSEACIRHRGEFAKI